MKEKYGSDHDEGTDNENLQRPQTEEECAPRVAAKMLLLDEEIDVNDIKDMDFLLFRQ